MSESDPPLQEKADVCSVCGVAMPEGAERCEACGATRGERHKCPFCGVVAQPQPHPSLRFVCPACGAPRVPATDASKPSARVTKALGTARSARSSRAVWKLASGLAAGFGALATLLLTGVALIASPSLFPLIAAGMVTAMPLVFAALAWWKVTKRDEQLKDALDEAWMLAANDLVETRGSIRAPQLAEAFGIEQGLADELLARLAAQPEIATDVTDEGDLALSVRAPERLRIASPLRVEPTDAPQAEQVEEEVVAHEEQDAMKGRS